MELELRASRRPISPPDTSPSSTTAARRTAASRSRSATGTAAAQTATVTATVNPHVNDAPVITSNGGGDTAAVSMPENSTAVTTVQATDPDSPTLTYALTGGADAALFHIDATTGAIAFNAAPDFEHPDDTDHNNSYLVQVSASDGGLPDDQTITVSVGNVNEAPVIASNGGGDAASIGLPENTTAVTTVSASDPDAATALTYSILGGADAALFQINAATGALSFVTAPDFEAPADTDHNNSYLVQVRASDGSLSDTQAITVNVTDVAEAPPPPTTFTSARPVDFNADGTDDLLFRNGDGSVSVFVSSNGHVNPPAGPSGSAPLSTDIVGTGDFNGDGRGDILFRSSDGHITEWLMNGGQIQAITDIGSTSPDYHVAGTGDFNGDHTEDILFRGDNGQIVTWSMQSGYLASIQTAGTTDAASHIQGTGDFNGDGRTDVLFRSDTGQVTTWLMNANGQAGAIVSVGSAPASTHIAATGDFNGDNQTDILFRADDGHVTEWLMNGGRIASIVENIGSADASWHIQGAGDVNGNGTDDVIWRNDDGHVVDWMMAGGRLVSIQDLGNTPVPTHIGGSQFDLL